MDDVWSLRFRIDAFTPDTIPMGRLGSYLTALAALLGHDEEVRFRRLDARQLTLVIAVAAAAEPSLRARLAAMIRREGAAEALAAFDALDDRLAEDHAIGVLLDDDDDSLLVVPGRSRGDRLRYGLVRQAGSLDGVLIRLGGRSDETIPAHLRDGDRVHICATTEPLALRLAPHYRRDLLRVFGTGRWQRGDDGSWTRLGFLITDFVTLDDRPLATEVGHLRAAATPADWWGAEWPGAGSGGAAERAHALVSALRMTPRKGG